MSGAESKRDLLALQGTWKQVAFEQDGIEDPPDTHGAPDSLTTIIGDRYSVRTPEGDLILEGTLVLDASITPKCIIWTDDVGPAGDKSLTCSYILEDDRFTFIGAHDQGPRPTEFRTRKGQSMRTFVRCRGQST